MTKITREQKQEALMKKYFDFIKSKIEESLQKDKNPYYLKQEIYSSLYFQKMKIDEKQKMEDLSKRSLIYLSEYNYKDVMLSDIGQNVFMHKFMEKLDIDENIDLLNHIIKIYPKSKYSPPNFFKIFSNVNLLNYREIDIVLSNKNIFKNIIGEQNKLIENINVIEEIIKKTPEIKRTKLFNILEDYFPEILIDELRSLEDKYLSKIQKIIRGKENKSVKKEKNTLFDLSELQNIINNTKEIVKTEFEIQSKDLLAMGFKQLSILDMYGIKIRFGAIEFNTELNNQKNNIEVKIEFKENDTTQSSDERENFKKNMQHYKAFAIESIIYALKEINLNLIEIKKEKKTFGDILKKYVNEDRLIQYIAKLRENELKEEMNKLEKNNSTMAVRRKI